MKHRLIIILTILYGCLNSAAQTTADFYVSTKGSDNWSGTLASPNAQGTDGPFASLERARDAVRILKKKKTQNILVQIREGLYKLNKTVVFGLEDSAAGNATITYAAYPNEKPIFSSGKEISGWEKVTTDIPGLPTEAKGNIWVANVSDKFLTLYDDKGMLPRAQSEPFKPLKESTKNKIYFPKGKMKNYSNVTDVELIVRPAHDWILNILPLASVDENKGVANTTIDATYVMQKNNVWVENVIEELNAPGEWVLNSKEGKVYLWKRGDFPIVAPTLMEFIRVEGKIDKKGSKDVPVRNLKFDGLTFKHGERYIIAKEDAGLQHDWDFLDKGNALVRFRGAENCVVNQCHFMDSGSGAIRVDLYGIDNKITNNHIEHMGGGGILLCGFGPGTKDVNKKNLVYNNNIHHVGEIYWHSPGIFLWQSGENRVANNLIHHTNYTGLIVSGGILRLFKRGNGRELMRTLRWDEMSNLPKKPEQEDIKPYLHSRNNLIEYNEIHNAMQKLGDGNGIYIRGAGLGNVIRRNFIHDLVTPTGKQGGMRTDGGQMDVLITENIIYKCTSQGMTLKLNNRFENNIIADVIAPPRGVYLKIVEGPMTGASNKKNIFYSSTNNCVFIPEHIPGKSNAGEDMEGKQPARMKDVDSDNNIYFCKTDSSKGDNTLKYLHTEGVDKNSKAVDPLFVNPEKGDFRFKPDSPALKMGIVPIDMSLIGLRPN